MMMELNWINFNMHKIKFSLQFVRICYNFTTIHKIHTQLMNLIGDNEQTIKTIFWKFALKHVHEFCIYYLHLLLLSSLFNKCVDNHIFPPD